MTLTGRIRQLMQSDPALHYDVNGLYRALQTHQDQVHEKINLASVVRLWSRVRQEELRDARGLRKRSK